MCRDALLSLFSVMAFGGRDLSRVLQQVPFALHSLPSLARHSPPPPPPLQSNSSVKSQQPLQSALPAASRVPVPQAAVTGGAWAADDISDVEELV